MMIPNHEYLATFQNALKKAFPGHYVFCGYRSHNDGCMLAWRVYTQDDNMANGRVLVKPDQSDDMEHARSQAESAIALIRDVL